MSSDGRELRQRGIALAKAGDKDEARRLLQQSIRLEPTNEAAWLWLASVARDGRERAFCLNKVLEINPNNEAARQAMDALLAAEAAAAPPAPPPAPSVRRLGGESVSPPEPAVPARPQAARAGQPANRLNTADLLGQPPGVPLPTGEAVIDAQRRAEAIVRALNTAPADPTRYVVKTRRRAGEADIVRLRLTVAAAAAAGVAAFLIVGTIVVLSNDDLRGIVIAPTPTFSQTPTVTPTNTPGLTPTPSATPRRAFTPTPTVPGIFPTADIYQLEPTAIYPVVFEQPLRNAVSLLEAGAAAQALPTLRAEVGNTEGRFNPNPYYFEALAHAATGDFREAFDVLEEAEDRLPEAPNDNFRPLIDTGYAQVFWAAAEAARAAGDAAEARDLRAQARERAVLAIEGEPDAGRIGDPRIDDAHIILARTQAAEGDTADALETLDAALEIEALQTNTRILLEKGEIYYLRRDYPAAEYQAFLVLYIDPTVEAAYQLQIRAALAEGEPGEAVLYAQNYLFYYPGSITAFRLLGQAREAEGNPDLALVAYSQALAGDAETAEAAAVYQARGLLYAAQGRYSLAERDLSRAFDITGDRAVQVLRMDAAYRAGEYATVLEDADDLSGRAGIDEDAVALLRGRALIDRAGDSLSRADATAALNLLVPLAGAEGVDAADRATAFEYIARAQLAAGNAEAAAASIASALGAGETPARRLLRGQIAAELGEADEARRDFEWVLAWASAVDTRALEQAEDALAALNG